MVALLALAPGCGGGSDSEDPGTSNGGSTSGTSGGETTGAATSTAGAECDGAFATVMAPYHPNIALDSMGGFVADDQGLVFSAIPDPNQESYDSSLPPIIGTVDQSGNVETIYTAGPAALMGRIFIFEDDIVFPLSGTAGGVMQLPRTGGEATQLSEDDVSAGPVSDGTKLYYEVRPFSGPSTLFALDVATGETETLAEREPNIVTIALDGDSLYFVEEQTEAGESGYSLYRLPSSGGSPELVMQLPENAATEHFHVVGDVAFASTLTEDFAVQIHRTEFGQPPEVIEDQGGMPMLVAGDTVYYNAGSALEKNSLEFDNPVPISASGGMGVAAIGVSSSHLWYSSGPCVYREPL